MKHGWKALVVGLLPGLSAPAAVVINEIFFDPPDVTQPLEFVELYNDGASSVDLSGWFFSDGISGSLPPGATLPAGAFAVIAQNPAALAARYGVTAAGAFADATRLANEGERLVLRDAGSNKVDEVDYQLGSPWPTASGGSGASMELIHPSLDNDLGGSWRASVAGPTPGQVNSVWATNAAPQVRQVDHLPVQPAGGQPVTITAKVTDPQGVSAVTLSCQVVPPGAFLPAWTPLTVAQLNALTTSDVTFSNNPAFEAPTNWSSVSMRDDGADGDAIAGDSVFTAVVSGQVNRTLLRYRIRATDAAGQSVTLPYPDDPSLNFACFVYNGVPAYTAATLSVAGSVPYVHGTNVMTSMPVYHMITRSNDYATCLAYSDGQLPNGHWSRWVENWECAFVYDGKVYDHVRYRLRGANGRYLMAGKRSFRVRFNRGRRFEARDMYGEKYEEPWTHLDISKLFDNRIAYPYSGNFGLAETINQMLWNMMGVPNPRTHWFHFRVVDGVSEAPTSANGQYYGDFHGLFLAMERYDRRFLEINNLPDGNLYKLTDKIDNFEEEQRVQGYDAVTNGSDYTWIYNTLNSTRSETQLFDQVNIDRWCSYRAVLEGVRIYDFPAGYNKNEAWYFNLTETNAYNRPYGKLWILPYDHDLTWGPNWNSGGERVYLAAFWKPTIRQQLRNRIREFRDLVWTQEVINTMIDDLASRIESFVPADRDRWRSAPADAGTMDWGPLSNKVADMKLFAFTWAGGTVRWPGGGDPESQGASGGDVVGSRAKYLDTLASANSENTYLPYTPTIAYGGPAGYPANALVFTSSAFGDPQGAGTFGAMAWRLGGITSTQAPAYDATAPRVYEMPAVWESGEMPSFTNLMAIPPGVVKVGHAYRARVRMKDTTGRWSHWSAPHEFIVSEPDTSASLRQYLRLTEVMFNPSFGDQGEFIELCNTSDSLTLDLGGAKFTDGVDYTFPPGTTLAPGAFLLVVGASEAGNFGVFRTMYSLSTNVAIAGPYEGRLNDTGEKLELKTAASGLDIVEFSYGDGRGWPIAADGAGHSLVPLTMDAQADGGLDSPDHWRASAYRGGSPGGPDPQPPSDLVLNEILAHTDYFDPAHPEYDSNDRIEIFNVSDGAVPFADWYLSDDPSSLKKWALPGAGSLGPAAWAAWDEVSGFHSPTNVGFGLDKAGETVLLSYLPGNGLDRVADAVAFKGQLNGVSIGRVPDGTGPWYALAPTLGYANAEPGPHVLITEVMYHPPPTVSHPEDNTFDEYIEIHNPTAATAPLENASGSWRLSGDVEFTFPAGQSLTSGAYAVIVPFSPSVGADRDAFLALHGLSPGSVALYGPWTGKLSNAAGRLAVEMPQDPDLVGEPVNWVIVDEVYYGSRVDWSSAADGGGAALERRDARPANAGAASWQAVNAHGTPGQGPDVDRDVDGLPDSWEWSTFGGTGVVSGLWFDDFDADGRPNGLEYVAGTDGKVQDGPSDLWISSEAATPVVGFLTRMTAGAGYFGLLRFYDLQSTPTPSAGWTNVPGYSHLAADGGIVTHTNAAPAPGASHFRLRINLEPGP